MTAEQMNTFMRFAAYPEVAGNVISGGNKKTIHARDNLVYGDRLNFEDFSFTSFQDVQ